jgi:YhcH/YjgK/YiaL family protein
LPVVLVFDPRGWESQVEDLCYGSIDDRWRRCGGFDASKLAQKIFSFDSAGMAIFGPFSTVRAQSANDPRFAAAHAYLADLLDPNSAAFRRLNQIAAGVTERTNLAGGAFALEQVYHAKRREDVFLESHRKYIDVQLVLAGAERMEVIDISRLTVSESYLAERDLIKYADSTATSHLRMNAGNVAIFFPADGHLSTLLPDAGPVLVRKSVVKVPVG